MWVIGYAKAGREFEVRDELAALGITASVPRKVEAKRVPTQRRPVAVTSPYLPNYLFAEVEARDWPRLRDVKYLAHTLQVVPQYSVIPLLDFVERVEEAYLDRMARIEVGQRIEEYAPGDLIEITQGPLSGQLARFRAIVESRHDLFPRLRAEGVLFGQAVTVDVDPIHAKRATG